MASEELAGSIFARTQRPATCPPVTRGPRSEVRSPPPPPPRRPALTPEEPSLIISPPKGPMATPSQSSNQLSRGRASACEQSSPLQTLFDFLLFLVLFVTPWIISTKLKEVFNTTKNCFIGGVVVLAVLAWLISCLYNKKIRIPKGKVVSLYTCLIAWSAITISWSIFWRLSLVEFSYQLTMYFLFLVVYIHVESRERMENLLHFSIAAGVLTAGYALLQYYGLDDPVFKRLTRFFQAFLPASLDSWADFRFLILPPKPDEATKIYSTMGHRNYLAGYMIAVIPIAVSRFYAALDHVARDWKAYRCGEKQSPPGSVQVFGVDPFVLLGMTRAPLVYALSISLMFVTVLLSHTRGSWVGLTLCMTFFFTCFFIKFRRQAGWRRSVVVMGLFLFLVMVVGPLYIGFGSFSFRNPLNREPRSALKRAQESVEVTHGSAHQRLLIYRTALWIIFDKPSQFLFGTGFGTFGLHYMPYQKEVLMQDPDRSSIQKALDRAFEVVFFGGRKGNQHWMVEINKSIYAHNEILHFWSEIGLVGVILMLSLLFCFFLDAFTYLYRAPPDDDALLFLGMVGSVCAVLGHNLFTFDLHLSYTSSLFWFLIAACQRYLPRDEWVLRWAPHGEKEVQSLGVRFRCQLEETPEGAVEARVEHLSYEEDEAESLELPEWKLVLRSPSGKTFERKLDKGGMARVWRPPENGTWEGRLISPKGDSHSLEIDYTTPNPLFRPVAIGCLLLMAFMVYRAIISQAMLEHHWRNAFLKFRGKQFEESFLDYRKAVNEDPNRGEVLFDFGRALMDSNRNKPAIAVFERATRSFVDPANFHNVALCYYKEKDLASAERSYRSAIRLNPIYEQSLQNLSYMLMDKANQAKAQGDEATAKAHLDEAVELLERGKNNYYFKGTFQATLGAFFAQRGDMERAVAEFKDSLVYVPNQCKVWINYGTVLYNMKRYEEAMDAMRSARKYCNNPSDKDLVSGKFINILKGYYHGLLKEKPNDRSVITSYGRELVESGHYTEAQGVFQKLLSAIAPGDPEATFWQAECLLRQGYRAEAKTSFERLLNALSQEDELAGQIRDRLAEIRRQSSKALIGTSVPALPLAPLPTGLKTGP